MARAGTSSGRRPDGRSEYMRDSDAFSWYMERDPLLRSTIVSVVLLDEPPDMDVLTARGERASRLAPGFRHKVVEPPLRLANPRWVPDPDFDISYHYRRIAMPPPGSLDQVLTYACQSGEAGFDRERPLWEFTLVEGLAGGAAALIMKIHHGLTDGIGGMEMARFLFDTEPHPPDLGPMPEAPPARRHSTVDLALDALAHSGRRTVGLLADRARAMPRDALGALRHPPTAVAGMVDIARSVERMVRPITATKSPVMQDRRLAWHYDALTVPLDELRDSAHACGLRLNDAFLGAVTGGLLRYHERHGSPVEELRVTMPISIRGERDPVGGNRITLTRFPVPVGCRDPQERMQRIHGACDSARHEPSIAYTNAIAAALNLLPRAFVGGMLKHVDFLASNVPGLDVPVYLAGARVAGWYAFGPTIGAALNTTLISYLGQCHIGVNVDTGAVRDPELLVESLREGFAEIGALGGAARAS